MLDHAFDIAIVDGSALDRLWQGIAARKAAEDPVYLPVLFLTSRDNEGMVTEHLGKHIDDILLAPYENTELQARIESMLHTRRLSLKLNSEANQNTSLARKRSSVSAMAL